MREIKVWRDEYRDIAYEVSYQVGPGIWNYYLWIRLEQLPAGVREEFWLEPQPLQVAEDTPVRYVYPQKSEPPIGGLDWHGGCTFYQKFVHGDEPRIVQVGCDYNHYFDTGRTYSLDFVMQDARRCIDSLHEQFVIKRSCSWCGKWFPPDGEEKRCPDCKEDTK